MVDAAVDLLRGACGARPGLPEAEGGSPGLVGARECTISPLGVYFRTSSAPHEVLHRGPRAPAGRALQDGDLPSSTHFFSDIGNGNLLAFFDFPEDPMPTRGSRSGECGSIAIAVPPEHFELDTREAR